MLQNTPTSFSSLGLSEAILRAIHSIGFEHPTPIQSVVIPHSLQGKDVIGLAQTGSGKTAAFCIPIAERLLHSPKSISPPTGLILCPTREIALQTKTFLDLFGKHHHLTTACIIGGVKIAPQITALKKHPDIVVATPGRLMDHMEKGNVRLDKVKELVLDEADHMLDLGFLPQIENILYALPRERQTLMFSATMSPSIERLAQRFLNNPTRIDVLPEGRAAVGISHRVYMVDATNKQACLLALLTQESGSTLVFTQTKVDANWVFRTLEKAGLQVTRMHSDCTQRDREDSLLGFREGKYRIMVATGIASRGIDVPGIQHVVNFDMPDSVEEYIHRAGRTARGNAIGLVSTIATWQDKPMLRDIEKTINQEVPRCTLPGVPPYIELKNVRPFGRGRRF
ncbi:MAG: DEAD/DEAH box helicase [Deltaproteobacteria bacterium]|nr:MAG: DEAD/DEAH box helicase [Deltaproteobacteria bacterium]